MERREARGRREEGARKARGDRGRAMGALCLGAFPGNRPQRDPSPEGFAQGNFRIRQFARWLGRGGQRRPPGGRGAPSGGF